MGKGLTMTIIFEASSLNYGEGIGNISELKKLNRGNGTTHTFASRQALGYDIRRLGAELFDWNLDTVIKDGTTQHKEKVTIKESEEMDLFGYMKTAVKGTPTRSAVVRLSPAISLEPYKSDMDFLSNKGMADRIDEDSNLANVEQHQSFYTYTLTLDLDKVGIDGDIELEEDVKERRVRELLTIVKLLNRNIRGRQENLAPLFVIGGVYNLPNPFFQGRINLEDCGEKYGIDIDPINDTLKTGLLDNKVEDNTFVGIVDGVFANKKELEEILKNSVLSVEEFFKKLETKVKEIYE
ncbi:type I-B CRISPR-associated protein Cas7/Cst2/DevR [Sporohalobacter salinus]|uniref:type I-B CRISPR-associated protein Cas7/Cst2/DevR n=1 Tax=Sporohalobacter salinus TaxID=1494606 RepID=UPI0019621A6A|nr:type I-B CRISPR-associated protein Cas7/Cst2/DevR [Sporohalobacter salinus]MBM7623757.1 CRISPR-associated protein Cst2 [Sporohalobacter salinus]